MCTFLIMQHYLPPTTTCVISFSLAKFSSLFVWFVNCIWNSLLIGLFNAMILSWEIRSTFTDLILSPLPLIDLSIFPIHQSERFNRSLTLGCKTYFWFSLIIFLLWWCCSRNSLRYSFVLLLLKCSNTFSMLIKCFVRPCADSSLMSLYWLAVTSVYIMSI